MFTSKYLIRRSISALEKRHEFILPSKRLKMLVVITKNACDAIINEISKDFSLETGGILLGNYSIRGKVSFVLSIAGPPTDSISTKNGFIRGVIGLQNVLDRHYRENIFYIGEWHFHPAPDGSPSLRDVNSMKRIAKNRKYSCSIPILIIGFNDNNGIGLKYYVFNEHELISEGKLNE